MRAPSLWGARPGVLTRRATSPSEPELLLGAPAARRPVGEQGWRISIHIPSLLIDGTPESAAPAPAISLHFVKHPVTMTDGTSPGGCCYVRFSRIFAVLAAQSRAKDKCSCVETFTQAPEVMLRELQHEKQQLCREIQRRGKRLLTKPSWRGLPST